MPNVTVTGSDDQVITIPFSSGNAAAIAQAAASVVAQFVSSRDVQQAISSGDTADIPSGNAGIVVDSPDGTGGAIVWLPGNFVFVADDQSGSAVFASAAGSGPSTIIAGSDAALTYFNAGNGADFFSDGGGNFIENSATATGTADFGGGLGFVGATMGSTVVEASDGAVLAVQGGGGVTVNATGAVATLFVTAGSVAAPVDINGDGSSGILVDALGGAAFVNPGTANVTVFAGAGGSATVFGADSLTGGSGSLTVLYADGYYVGGSGGGNIMVTAPDAGGTTLVGGSGSDTMFGIASGDILRSTSGNDLMITYTGGDTLIAGTGSVVMFGAGSGGNTFVFDGNGGAVASGDYGSQSAASNLYVDSVGGGSIYISDFRPGMDVFQLPTAVSVASMAFTPSNGSTPGYSAVTLSDGTQVLFNYAHVGAGDFRTV